MLDDAKLSLLFYKAFRRAFRYTPTLYADFNKYHNSMDFLDINFKNAFYLVSFENLSSYFINEICNYDDIPIALSVIKNILKYNGTLTFNNNPFRKSIINIITKKNYDNTPIMQSCHDKQNFIDHMESHGFSLHKFKKNEITFYNNK